MLLLVKQAVVTLSLVIQASSGTADKTQVQETSELVWVVDSNGKQLFQITTTNF